MSVRYLEDFAPGQTYRAGPLTVTAEAVAAFAREFDPQPFHLDAAAARASPFGGLAASGWHTGALNMRLVVASDLRPAGGVLGVGLDELRWPRAVRPGDALRVEIEILAVRPSQSRPGEGLVKLRTTTLNQHDQPVQVMVANILVPRRPA
ncbi:MAG: MaoC family dehydratase [Rhodospirillales bacterium]